MSSDFEKRLEELREEARTTGSVAAAGARPVGGPIPSGTGLLGEAQTKSYGVPPLLKPPVWEWMIPVYFFVGGLAGASAVIALAALATKNLEISRAAMWAAGAGGIASPILLTWDLGRPLRFLNMLRVFKYQSPMSVGSWILAAFGGCGVPGAALMEWHWRNVQAGISDPVLGVVVMVLVIGSAVLGAFLSTYTGALLAVTSVPVWSTHRMLLPLHFGISGLGSAAALLELSGFSQVHFQIIGFVAAGVESLVLAWLELRRHGAVDRSLRQGSTGWTVRIGEMLEGPVALALRSVVMPQGAAVSFLAGALMTRFGWVRAGRASACDTEAVLESQNKRN